MSGTAEINKKLSQIWGKQPEQMIEKTIEAEIVQKRSFLPPQNIVNYHKNNKYEPIAVVVAPEPIVNAVVRFDAPKVEVPKPIVPKPIKEKKYRRTYNTQSILKTAEILNITKTRVYLLLQQDRLKSENGVVTEDSIAEYSRICEHNKMMRVHKLMQDRYNNSKYSTDTHLCGKDAAAYLGVSLKAFYNYISRGKIKKEDGLIAIEELERFKIKDKYKLSEVMKAMKNEEGKEMKNEEINVEALKNTNLVKNKTSSHYQLYNGVEAIDVIKKMLTYDEYVGFLKGNILKYQLRIGKKDDVLKEITKIKDYTNELNSLMEKVG